MHAQNMMNHSTTITGYDNANKHLNIQSRYRGSNMSKYCRLRVFLLGTCIPPPPSNKRGKKKKILQYFDRLAPKKFAHY